MLTALVICLALALVTRPIARVFIKSHEKTKASDDAAGACLFGVTFLLTALATVVLGLWKLIAWINN